MNELFSSRDGYDDNHDNVNDDYEKDVLVIIGTLKCDLSTFSM